MSYVILRVFNLKDLETLKKTKICYLKIPSLQPFLVPYYKKKHTHKNWTPSLLSLLLFKKSLFKKDYSPMIKGF